ncbi:sugar-transfer associated ATP-grasp domain-containing protein [Actibacterium sp. D379-3]
MPNHCCWSEFEMTIAERDQANYLSARDSSPKDLLIYAAKNSGRSVLQIQREFNQMAKSHSQLNMVEYVRNGLFDIDRYTQDERDQFISNDLHWPITHKCCHKGWTSAAEDKVLAATLLQAGGVPVPETVAVFDQSPRIYPGLNKISSVEGLRELLTTYAGEPLFCKIVDGMVSFGAFRIEDGDDNQIVCTGHPPMSHDHFLAEFVGSNAYVIQRELRNHSGFAKYASALGTVRMVNMVMDTGVYCPIALIKLPQGGNIADAFWRPGNLACAIDVETGRILTIARRGIETEFLDDHPDHAGLVGLELPFWSELCEINDRAGRIFAPIRYQSTDIAITEAGPVIVELNYGGGFDLPQYASGRGLLTPQVRAFFESCGVEFGRKKKRRLGIFGG